MTDVRDDQNKDPRPAADDDSQEYAQWLGNSEERQDRITAWPIHALAAALDLDQSVPADGTLMPPMRHWLYFLEAARSSELGPDGHPARGGFLPPVRLPRRMWAAGRMQFNAPIKVGDKVHRRSTVQDVRNREGRSGRLVFVRVVHDFFVGEDSEDPALSETHTVVYRDHPSPDDPPSEPRPAPAKASWTEQVVVDPVLLFRYSALTFNGHRIHYDADYCRREEGYPGLVVHGPLLATLVLDLCLRNVEKPVKVYDFRVLRPVFADQTITLAGRLDEGGHAHIWILDGDDALTLEGRVEFAGPEQTDKDEHES